MEEKKEMKPEVPAEEKKEAASETKPAAPLLTKEALKMVHTILGRGFIREHPEGWAILKNRLKDEVRPITEENKTLLAEVGDLEIARKTRREAYEALPKCAACKSTKGRMMYFVTPEGSIELYHSQCGGDKLLTFRYETAKAIAEKIKARKDADKFRGEDIMKGVTDAFEIMKVQDELKTSNNEEVREAAAKKDALKVAGQIAANLIASNSKKNPNQTLIGMAMASAAIAKEKTTK